MICSSSSTRFNQFSYLLLTAFWLAVSDTRAFAIGFVFNTYSNRSQYLRLQARNNYAMWSLATRICTLVFVYLVNIHTSLFLRCVGGWELYGTKQTEAVARGRISRERTPSTPTRASGMSTLELASLNKHAVEFNILLAPVHCASSANFCSCEYVSPQTRIVESP